MEYKGYTVFAQRFLSFLFAINKMVILLSPVFQTDADRKFLAAKGSVPIGIGKNTHIKRAIIDKNARIGENVKVVNSNYVS